MELLALVIINLIFAVVLYYAVSIKVTNSVKEYQSKKFKADMNRDILLFYKESESYLAQMDSRIVILRNLIQKAESLNLPNEVTSTTTNLKKENSSFPILKEYSQKETVKNLQAEENIREGVQALGVNREYLKNEFIHQKENYNLGSNTKNKESKSDSLTSGPILMEFITGLGKGVKSFLGINDPLKIEEHSENYLVQSSGVKNSLDYSIGGDPFKSQTNSIDITNNMKEENSFAEVLSMVQHPQEVYGNQKKDEIKISAGVALKEIPESATRIEKVVFLLKKNYSHSEIATELGIAIPEVSLIETIKFDRRGIFPKL
ncbi:MAG: hypothetical protein L6Q54_04065 [Leptospiraceae bacterium]|nr:hypothetical protein [Leptospiraceae bacterium]MCK6380410.1 hypothetical protein [Leptospiraceae bacterium]NUM41565.1 hypothetical protein [Leptospiraceae bacterium]